MGGELVVLGAGSILPRAGYGCSGYALSASPGGEVTLLDCGPGSVRALGGAGIALERVRRVVLSHYHPDHCLDLLALLFARRNPDLDSIGELELIGPRGLRDLLDGGRRAFGRWVADERMTARELGREVPTDEQGRAELRTGELQLRCVPTGHSPEAVAWRVELPGASLAYTGDSPPEPRVADLASGVDLFVAECSFSDEAATPNHLSPSSAGRMAARAGCRRLLLSHFYPALDPEEAVRVAREHFAGPIEAARDGSRHPVGGRRPA